MQQQRRFVGCLLIVLGFTIAATEQCVLAQQPGGHSPIEQARRIDLPFNPQMVAMSRSGAVVTVASGRTVIAVDATNGTQLARWDVEQNVVDLDLSADGRVVAVTSSTPDVGIYDARTGDRTQIVHRKDAPHFLRKDGQRRIALYPDGTKLISTGGKRRLFLSDIKTGLWDHIIYIKYSRVATPTVCPNGRHVALISSPDANELSGHVSMFKIRRGLQPLWTKWHRGNAPVAHVAFSPDSSRLATCGNGDGVRVWDVASGKLTFHLEVAEEPLIGVTFLADCDQLLVASPTTLTFVDARDPGEPWAKAVSESPLKGFAASSDGRSVVTFSKEACVDVWSLKVRRTSE